MLDFGTGLFELGVAVLTCVGCASSHFTGFGSCLLYQIYSLLLLSNSYWPSGCGYLFKATVDNWVLPLAVVANTLLWLPSVLEYCGSFILY